MLDEVEDRLVAGTGSCSSAGHVKYHIASVPPAVQGLCKVSSQK